MKLKAFLYIAAAIVLVWAFGIWLGPEGDYQKPSGELVGPEARAVPEAVHTISCQWASGDIQITLSPDDQVYIQTLSEKGSGSHHAMAYGWYEGTLSIEDDQDEGFVDKLIGEEKNQLLVLQLPREGIERVTLDQDIGDVTLKDVAIDDLTIAMGPGNLTITGNFDRLSADMQSGTLDFTSDRLPSTLTVTDKAGDVRLDLPPNDGFTLTHDLADGELTSAFHLVDKDAVTAIHGNGNSLVSVTLNKGNLTLA